MTSPLAVIGGAGFIGTRLVRRLLRAGREVRILDIRPSREFASLTTRVDVCDRPALRRALEGAGAIVNLAAEHADDVRPVSRYYEVNVGGAENICAVAEQHGIERILFTSTVAVYGFSEAEVDEEGPLRPFNHYGRSKLQAEQVFARWQAAGPARTLVTVRPTVVFGEDNRGNVYNLLRQISSGHFVMVGAGRNRKSMAYVENVAAFLEHVLKLPPGQHCFNYADKPDFDMNGLISLVRAALGRHRPPLRIPYPLGLLAGYMFDAASRVTGIQTPVSAIRVRKFCANTRFAAERMRQTGFVPPVPLEEGLRRTIASEFGASS